MRDETQLHDLLPAYVAGSLDAAGAAEFGEHLRSCPICRRELEFMEQVRKGAERHGSEFFAEHPEVDDIVAFATGVDVGTGGASVGRHVELCVACSAEVGWVRGKSSPAVASPRAAAPRRLPASAMWGWAAAAASLTLLVLSWTWTLRPGVDSLDPGSGPTSLGIVRPVERGAADLNRIVLRPHAVTVALNVWVDLPPTAYPAAIELLDAAGVTVVRDSVSGPEVLVDGFFFPLSCSIERCPPGDYAVRIAAGTPEEHRLSLTLVQAHDP